MKVHILFDIKEGPWGGGNQFLKSLRDIWRETGKYSETPVDADVILVNSHQIPYFQLYSHCNTGNEKIIVHRIDGPISLVRGRDEMLDILIFYFNNLVSDGTIFQSEWSKTENYKLGYRKNEFETVIINAPNQKIFYKRNIQETKAKIKIIATSWSSNIRKGFEIYQFLDDNLDFSKYEMTFAGNSPIKFKNIKHVRPLPSDQLANLLRDHDIYITASINEPCSNSLIEALYCGLPAVYLRQGSHESIVGDTGEGFTGKNDVIDAIDLVSNNLNNYKNKKIFKSMDEVADEYYQFCEMIYQRLKTGRYIVKKIDTIKLMKIITKISLEKFKKFSKLAN